MFAPFSVPFHVGWWRKTATCSFLLQIYLQWDSPFLMLSQILAVLYWYQPMFLWRFRILFRWPPNISHTAHKSLSRVRITFRAEHFPTVLLANVPFQSAAVCRFLQQNHCWHQPVCSSVLQNCRLHTFWAHTPAGTKSVVLAGSIRGRAPHTGKDDPFSFGWQMKQSHFPGSSISSISTNLKRSKKTQMDWAGGDYGSSIPVKEIFSALQSSRHTFHR